MLQSPTAERIRERAGKLSPESVKLFYGETYDNIGNTLDSMKYYFFVAGLAKALQAEGFSPAPTILVADTAACRNVSPSLEQEYMSLGRERANFVERVNQVYGTGLQIVRMSEFIDSQDFIERRNQVMAYCKASPELMAMVEKSVPESKVEVERNKSFMYSFDEITTILGLDVKVGPPREDLYDSIARALPMYEGRKLMSLFLTPTFPVGMNWAFFFGFEGIEEHGITPYKGGSKGLQRNRVIVGRTRADYLADQINASFISLNPELPNPVLDVGIICEMARKLLDNDDSPIRLADDFYSGTITPRQLKEKVTRDADAYILSRF